MKRISVRFWLLILGAIATLIPLATSAVAQATVVVGTGNPDIDVPVVQAALDQGGEVILKGHFSFERAPRIPTAWPGLPPATTLISKAVVISGTREDDGDLTTIEGGTIPFYVDAQGVPVTFQRLRFIRPIQSAIFAYAVSGLTIASSKIERIVPPANTPSSGIWIGMFGVPMPGNPGHPENISGMLSIVNNYIDVAGGKRGIDNTLGITVFSAGVPGAEVEAHVSGNNISNSTEPAINFRRIVGRADIEGNVITTGPVFGSASRNMVIRVANLGSYLIVHNSIDCGWAKEAAGIGVFSQIPAWPMEHAIVVDNSLTMSPPEGTVLGAGSAGILMDGNARTNVVLNNRIRGRATAGITLAVTSGGIPDSNALVLNHFDDFQPSVADIFVGNGVTNTRILGPGTVEDHGVGSVIVP
jgi:hypothetical protein